MPLAETLPLTDRGARSSWIEIRLDRLSENLAFLKKILGAKGSAPQVMAVVKANAYGHGLVETARAISSRVAYLGVSSLSEILELREHGIKCPLFLFGRLFGSEIAAALKNGATLSVSSFEEAAEISEAAETLVLKAKVHVKVDTGMGRLGIPAAEAFREIKKIMVLPGITVEGIYTHFPTAEREDGFTEKQLEILNEILYKFESGGIRFHFVHASNSAGNICLEKPAIKGLNLVRPGLILYGISPDPQIETGGFKPVLSLKSRIILVKKVEAGQTCGYGRTYTASRATTLATLPIGYSHGYPWSLSGKSFVLYKGKRFPIAGRVSMDYITIDLMGENAKAGDEVTLLGEDNGKSITAEELAKWAGTIPYEIVTRLSPRLPRFYFSQPSGS